MPPRQRQLARCVFEKPGGAALSLSLFHTHTHTRTESKSHLCCFLLLHLEVCDSCLFTLAAVIGGKSFKMENIVSRSSGSRRESLEPSVTDAECRLESPSCRLIFTLVIVLPSAGHTCENSLMPALMQPTIPALPPSLRMKRFLPFPLDTASAVRLLPGFSAVRASGGADCFPQT